MMAQFGLCKIEIKTSGCSSFMVCLMNITFFFTDGTWTAENSGIVLRNPVNPFTGGVETLSDAPIPLMICLSVDSCFV